MSLSTTCTAKRTSAIFAIEKIAHSGAAGLVSLSDRLTFIGIHLQLAIALFGVGHTALGTAIGKTRFAGLQLKLFLAYHAHFNRKRHTNQSITGASEKLSDK